MRVETVAITANGNGDNELVAALPRKRIQVVGLSLSFSGAVNARLGSGWDALTGLWYGAVNIPIVLPVVVDLESGGYWCQTEPGRALNLWLSAGGTMVGGLLVYRRVHE